MADEFKTGTCGVDHVGLSVRDLASTRKFFCDCLGWRIVGERADYPAVFVSDGHDVVTLWQVDSPGKAIPFDRRANVGLHHLALAVVDQVGLDTLHKRVSSWPASSSSSVRNPRVPAPRFISSCGSLAEYGSNLRSIRASRTRARRGEPVQASVGREEEDLL